MNNFDPQNCETPKVVTPYFLTTINLEVNNGQ